VSLELNQLRSVSSDTIIYKLFIKNKSKSDSIYSSIFLPEIHSELNCLPSDTLSFIEPYVGGTPRKTRNSSLDWPTKDQYLILPGTYREFNIKLHSIQLCTLEYYIYSCSSKEEFYLLIGRTISGNTNVSIIEKVK